MEDVAVTRLVPVTELIGERKVRQAVEKRSKDLEAARHAQSTLAWLARRKASVV